MLYFWVALLGVFCFNFSRLVVVLAVSIVNMGGGVLEIWRGLAVFSGLICLMVLFLRGFGEWSYSIS